MKKKLLDILNELFNENILDNQVKWEYLKYDIESTPSNFLKN